MWSTPDAEFTEVSNKKKKKVVPPAAPSNNTSTRPLGRFNGQRLSSNKFSNRHINSSSFDNGNHLEFNLANSAFPMLPNDKNETPDHREPQRRNSTGNADMEALLSAQVNKQNI